MEHWHALVDFPRELGIRFRAENRAGSGVRIEQRKNVSRECEMAPGVSMNTSSGKGYGNFSAFGLPGTSNLFTINGNDYNDPFLNLNNSGASNLLLGTNDIQEVEIGR